MSNLITLNTDLNIYQLLNPKNYDPHSVYNRDLILQPYQTIPKYYLYSSKENSLILHFAPGSGKSITSIFAALYYIDLYKMFIFNSKFIPKSNKTTRINTLSLTRNCIYVGSWATQQIVCQELLRKELGFFRDEQISTMEDLLNSPISEQRAEGRALRNKLTKQIEKYIEFIGYQSLFNQLFPNIKFEKFNQDATVLLEEYKSNRLEVSDDFINKVKNSIIIIDEMQRLYSVDGMNSYGFAVMMLSKISKIYNIKMVFLTGTMINTSLYEIIDILNIIRPEKELLSPSDFTEQQSVLDDMKIETLKKSKIPETMAMFYNNFMYYNPNDSSNIKSEVLSLTEFQKKNKDFYAYISDDTYSLLTYEQMKYLPQEVHIGNRLITDSDSIQQMILYSVEVEGYQKEEYKKYIQRVSQLSYSDLEKEDENESSVLIQDGYIPSKDQYKYGIIEQNGVYSGKFLKLDNIKKYSALGYETCQICLNNTFNNEKTIIYHSKLQNFGIYQYAAILNANGFIKVGDSPKNESLCKFCKNTFESHSLSLEERLKLKVCNNFIPMKYDILTGNISQFEREQLLSNFNSPLNLYGDLMSIVFVSDVAYSGVSFLNTNNIIILSRMSNISKWKQITARIIRTRSHSLLPINKRYAKIYTMIIHYPDELKEFPKLKKFTIGERYYKIHEILNKDIENYLSTLSEKCIGNLLFNNPQDYKITPAENTVLNNLYLDDLIKEIKFIMNRISYNTSTSIWTYDTLIKRIKDPQYAPTFLDLHVVPTKLLENLILEQKFLSSFKFSNDDKNTKYVKINTDNNEDLLINKLSSFSFNKIYNINMNSKNLKILIHNLEKEKSELNKINILRKILKFTSKSFITLANIQVFWDAIYDLGDEYYDDDEEKFFYNHCRKNRNKSKMTGMYYGEIIIKTDGTTKQINYKFPQISNWPNVPYLFKITCLVISESSPFYLHVNIIKANDAANIDARKINKGIVCTSFNKMDEIKKCFPELNKELNKKTWCSQFLYILCEKQASSEIKSVMSPFEK